MLSAHNSVCVTATLSCQHLELANIQAGGYTCEEFFLIKATVMGPTLNPTFCSRRSTLNLGNSSSCSLDEGQGKEAVPYSSPAPSHSCWQIHSFPGIGAYFFGIPSHTEDQLRLQPYRLNNYWILKLSNGRQPLLK